MRRSAVAVGFSAVLAAAAVVPVALHRFMDTDEGYYAIAAEAVLRGEVPYRDFFYTQSPGLPYLHAGWIALTEPSWTSLRLLGALVSVATSVVVHLAVRRRTGSDIAAVAAAVATATCALAMMWLPTVKTYGLTALGITAACWLIDRDDPSGRQIAAAGLCAGLAVLIRLPLGAALPVMAFWPTMWGASRRRSVLFLGTATLTMAPMLVFAIVDLEGFLFGNVEYHSLRSDGGLVGSFDQKVQVLRHLVGVESRMDTQFTVLLVLSLAGAMASAGRGRRPALALPVAGVLFVVMLTPTPTYGQYQSVIVPLLVISAADLASYLPVALDRRSPLWLVPLGALWLIMAKPALETYVTQAPRQLRPESVTAVSSAIERNAGRDSTVLAVWPGYLFGTGVPPARGLENNFGIDAAEFVSGRRASDLHLMGRSEIRRAAERGLFDIVLHAEQHFLLRPIPWDRSMLAPHYDVVTEVGDIEIFARG